MIIYLCPTDKKYACSWEGQAEDILPHFEQEHDDLLHFNNYFEVNLNVPSENRLFLIDEEIYLVQIKISDKMLNIFLRYLGPARIATKLTYNIILKVNYEYCHPKYIAVMEQGFINVDLGKLKDDLEEIRYLQCSLNIIKETNGNQSDDDVFLEENSLDEETDEKLPHMPPPSKKRIDEENMNSNNEGVMKSRAHSMEVSLSRSNTINLEDFRRRNMKRCKSTMSLGAISENDFSVDCSSCGILLSPPIYICPCGQNFCDECQTSNCRICNENVTYEHNSELEEKFNRFLLPCRYKAYGCPEKLIYNELSNHEHNCTFCDYKCPIDGCYFEGQFKHTCKHLKLIHGSTRILESFIVVFQNIPEAFLVNEDRGIFYCCVQYYDDRVLWQAKFCGPMEKRFFCELKFKDGKIKQPLLLTRKNNIYSIEISHQELKRLKLKAKHAVLTITS